MSSVTCAFDGCNKPQLSRGYCVACYARLRRAGRLPVLTSEDRLLAKVDKSPEAGGCWLWTGALSGEGYGQLRRDRRTLYAHRFMYERLIGEISEGLELDHLCRVRRCVNPDHLEPVTHVVNVIRGDGPKVNGSKTHCHRGHPFDNENTYTFKGSRMCRACRRIRWREGRVANASPDNPV